ncbi:hypothetical protein STEG23_031194, partial [Scotinomys teguina]
TTVLKTAWYWHKNRHVENGIELMTLTLIHTEFGRLKYVSHTVHHTIDTYSRFKRATPLSSENDDLPGPRRLIGLNFVEGFLREYIYCICKPVGDLKGLEEASLMTTGQGTNFVKFLAIQTV